jgi:hypothetical protein
MCVVLRRGQNFICIVQSKKSKMASCYISFQETLEVYNVVFHLKEYIKNERKTWMNDVYLFSLHMRQRSSAVMSPFRKLVDIHWMSLL